MGLEKEFEEVAHGNSAWIEGDLDYLRMAGVACAYLTIGGVIRVTTGISGSYLRYTRESLEYRFESPESSAAHRESFVGHD